MTEPERIDLNPEQTEALLERVREGALAEGDYEIIKAMIETIRFLDDISDQKATSIKRLMGMLFGAKTEKTKNVIANNEEPDAEPSTDRDPEDDVSPETPRKGHGRNSADDYTGAKKIEVPHESLSPGAKCPACQKGKVYRMQVPKVAVRIRGGAPLQADVYEMERFRCNLCGEIFTAEPPDGIGTEKYDPPSGAMIALLKYGSGFPYNRLQQLQGSMGIPLPASTQWDVVERFADRIHPAYNALITCGAGGDVIHNDDTTVKILSLINSEPGDVDPDRKGMYTTAVVSIVGVQKIALFFSGRKHAGENLAAVLAKRSETADPPIQMCDALTRNAPKPFEVILANCLAHGRRKFVDVSWSFPEECRHVLEVLGEAYKNDEITKKENMTPEERLAFHKARSGPIMKGLHDWMTDKIDRGEVEPNSGLGQAITYMLKHWNELTLFLRTPRAPLDNNICERALKKAILHRKNALFYKTEHGAYVGDLFMSLIHTCNLNQVNPFDYLVALYENSSALFRNPWKWLPWNHGNNASSEK